MGLDRAVSIPAGAAPAWDEIKLRLVSIDEPAPLRERAMGCDKIAPRQAIPVEKHAVAATARKNRAIANLTGAKVSVLVPHMGER